MRTTTQLELRPAIVDEQKYRAALEHLDDIRNAALLQDLRGMAMWKLPTKRLTSSQHGRELLATIGLVDLPARSFL